jgi:hypothetical protein
MGRNHRVTDWNPEDKAAWEGGNRLCRRGDPDLDDVCPPAGLGRAGRRAELRDRSRTRARVITDTVMGNASAIPG